ncbi:MAG: hypothetical protein OQJ97_03755 [Rhodospirillales bacterium]|nr:hypothetical protein [Rhodospirillales bacterium]
MEPFKENFNEAAICSMAKNLVRVAQNFDGDGFITFATKGLDKLELKQRSERITDALEKYLPNDFSTATNILLASLEPQLDPTIDHEKSDNSEQGIKGWPIMPMAEYIARRGQQNVKLSLDVLKKMTPLFSSEFAIRPFLQNHQELTLKTITPWTKDQDEHVRRLVSEGTRPRLPWGIRLTTFVKDPKPVVQLLETLKDDPSEYVRRSVANNLNDISKDHPELAVTVAQSWMKDASHERKRLIRHGLRSLIKAGNSGALKVLGYGPVKVNLQDFTLKTPSVTLGGALEFSLSISSYTQEKQPIIIDYKVYHMRANGKLSPKVFKWKTITIQKDKPLCFSRRHSIKPITTRRYYPGNHRVEIMINGETICGEDFTLKTD